MFALWFLTPRLEVLAASKCLARLETESLARLGHRLECEVPASWRDIMPHELAREFAAKLHQHPEDAGWWNWYGVTLEAPRTLAVSVGFKGWPHEGKVQIGYSVAREFRGQGLATEAVGALCGWAFRQGALCIGADVAPENLASRRVLEKCGFVLHSQRHDAHTGCDWLHFERIAARHEAI